MLAKLGQMKRPLENDASVSDANKMLVLSLCLLQSLEDALVFQKSSIWKQMTAYKELYLDSKARLEDSAAQLNHLKHMVHTITSSFFQVLSKLMF